MEKCLFPLKYMYITQGMNGAYSHKGSYKIDYTCKDVETRKVYAPFTGVIKKIYNHSVWLESNDKIIHADGSISYATAKFAHNNDISNLKVNQEIKQGEYFYTMGDYGNATGIHVEIEISKSKFKNNGWYENKYGVWCLYDAVEQYKSFFIPPDVVIKKSYNYSWKNLEEYTTGLYEVTCNVLTVRTGPSTTYDFVRYNDLTKNAKEQISKLSKYKPNGYVKGVKFDVNEINNEWGKTLSGWVCLKYAKKI